MYIKYVDKSLCWLLLKSCGLWHCCTPELHKNPLYHGACISTCDRVLIQVCSSWVVFEECPLEAGSLLAHIFHCLLFIFIAHVQV